MLFLLASLHAATTDELGGSDTYNNHGDQVKNLAIQVDEPVVITNVKYGVYNYRSQGEIHLVLYKSAGGNSWSLVEDVPAASVPADQEGWADSGEVQWVLEPGLYAVGALIPDSWYYYYSQQTTGKPWFGSVTGGVRTDATTVPQSFKADYEQYYYWMEITSESADADGDGFLADTWGGSDCDDADPAVGEATDEIPYDGVDQDCDGTDLTDVDGDGSIGQDAGGDDCDDQDPALVGPCDDILGGTDDPNKLYAAGCGCASAPEGAGAWALLALGGLVLRRRR